MWDEPRGGAWVRIEGDGRPLPDDRGDDGLSQYARDRIADRPPQPVPEPPRLHVVPQEPPQAAEVPVVAPEPSMPPARRPVNFDAIRAWATAWLAVLDNEQEDKP